MVPSSAACATLLLARLGSSECVALDVVLGVVGLALSSLPGVVFLLLWACHVSDWCDSRWITIAHSSKRASISGHPLAAMVKRMTTRRWEWNTIHGDVVGMVFAWPVLLEYRELRYGAIDSGVLLMVSIASVISGLDRSNAQCRGWGLVALLLLIAQVVVVLVVQPFTTLFSQVWAIITISLTCLGVLAQLVFVWSNSSWLIDAAAVCSLAVLGVSMLQLLLDGARTVTAMRRRTALLLQATFREDSRSSVEEVVDRDDLHKMFVTNDVPLFLQLEDSITELDAVIVSDKCSDDKNEHRLISGDDLFWDNNGAAMGTGLVEGHSDIIFTDQVTDEDSELLSLDG